MTVDVVIPAARASLVGRVVDAVRGGPVRAVIVAWDGTDEPPQLPGARVVRTGGGGGRGPAAARNAGWRASDADWIAFLDDDVVPPPDWGARLLEDLAALAPGAAGSMGRVTVPLPPDRAPTDWERNVARLQDTDGIITADCAVRRSALEAIGGFDERFPRAYREDTDLELRLRGAGWTIERGARDIEHPVRPADALVSVRLQRGNADDVLFWALHGTAGHVSVRTKATYAAVTGLAVAAVAARSRPAALGWLAWTARFFWRRAAPGPRTPAELGAMALTSAAIPPAALWHSARGVVRHRALVARRLRRRGERRARPGPRRS